MFIKIKNRIINTKHVKFIDVTENKMTFYMEPYNSFFELDSQQQVEDILWKIQDYIPEFSVKNISENKNVIK